MMRGKWWVALFLVSTSAHASEPPQYELGAWGLLMPAAGLGWLQLARRRRRTRQRTRA